MEFSKWFSLGPDLGIPFFADYNYLLVLLSVAMAIIASYVAFSFSECIEKSDGSGVNPGWLALGALALGLGVWSMHFIAMLSYSLPVNVGYDPLMTFVSVVPAVLAGFIVLQDTRFERASLRALIGRGVLMGSGIGLMHYIGMAAMRVDALMRFDPFLFVVSIMVAVMLAILSLEVKRHAIQHARYESLSELSLIGAAVLMGVAISGMHYTGMAAVSFYKVFDEMPVVDGEFMESGTLATIIGISVFAILISLLVIVRMTQHREAVRVLQLSNEELEKTVRERTREMQGAMRRAESANKAKTDFLSKMSHELRTPMNAIMGFSQLMEMDTVDPLSSSHRESVKEIMQAANHLLDLINEVLDIARIDSGNMNMAIEPVDLSLVMDEVRTLVRPLAEMREISLEFSYEDNVMLFVDRVRLKQGLINLVSNAIKYNNEQGHVEIGMDNYDSHMIRIYVKDDGFGIPENKKDEVFGEFNRLGAETSEIEGSGIGLALTKRIVEMMDGEIGFESIEGEGSLFWMLLPELHEEDMTMMREKDGLRLNVDRVFSDVDDAEIRAVLYIEDNPASLRIMRDIFRNCQNIKLVTTPRPNEGVEFALREEPDMLLLDINLPGMDGYDVLERIRSIPGQENIPAVAITAMGHKEVREKARRAGFDDFVSKPVDIRLVALLVKDYLYGEKAQERKAGFEPHMNTAGGDLSA